MSLTRQNSIKEARPADEMLESLARAVNLIVKLKVRELQGDRKLNEMILLLHSLGCRPVEIADALGKTANDVNPVISRARKRKAGGKKRWSKR